MNNWVIVHGLETAQQHAGGHSCHWVALFLAAVETFKVAIGQAVTQSPGSLDRTVWSF